VTIINHLDTAVIARDTLETSAALFYAVSMILEHGKTDHAKEHARNLSRLGLEESLDTADELGQIVEALNEEAEAAEKVSRKQARSLATVADTRGFRS
jgi:hypothetical protein